MFYKNISGDICNDQESLASSFNNRPVTFSCVYALHMGFSPIQKLKEARLLMIRHFVPFFECDDTGRIFLNKLKDQCFNEIPTQDSTEFFTIHANSKQVFFLCLIGYFFDPIDMIQMMS